MRGPLRQRRRAVRAGIARRGAHVRDSSSPLGERIEVRGCVGGHVCFGKHRESCGSPSPSHACGAGPPERLSKGLSPLGRGRRKAAAQFRYRDRAHPGQSLEYERERCCFLSPWGEDRGEGESATKKDASNDRNVLWKAPSPSRCFATSPPERSSKGLSPRGEKKRIGRFKRLPCVLTPSGASSGRR